MVFQTSSRDNDFLHWTGIGENFDILLICIDNKHSKKVENLNEHLKIEKLYKQHKDYITNIIRNAVIYNDSRNDELLELLPELYHSKQDVLNSVFMNYIDKESWGKRPLSILTHDIFKEFQLFTNI